MARWKLGKEAIAELERTQWGRKKPSRKRRILGALRSGARAGAKVYRAGAKLNWEASMRYGGADRFGFFPAKPRRRRATRRKRKPRKVVYY